MVEKIVQLYAARLSLNTEDVKVLFQATAESLYDGDMDAMVADLAHGRVCTDSGMVRATSWLDQLGEEVL